MVAYCAPERAYRRLHDTKREGLNQRRKVIAAGCFPPGANPDLYSFKTERRRFRESLNLSCRENDLAPWRCQIVLALYCGGSSRRRGKVLLFPGGQLGLRRHDGERGHLLRMLQVLLLTRYGAR